MNNFKRNALLIIIVWCIVFLGSGCSKTIISDGGGSETINAKIIVSDTTARFKAEIRSGSLLTVQIFSDQYKPQERIGFTDSLAGDSISIPAWSAPYSGKFNIIMSTNPSGKAAFISGVELKRGLCDTILCTLKTSFVFKGRIASQTPTSEYILFIQGSPFYCISDKMQHFTMRSLPSGRYLLKAKPIKGRLFMATSDYVVDTDSLGNNASVVIEEK